MRLERAPVRLTRGMGKARAHALRRPRKARHACVARSREFRGMLSRQCHDPNLCNCSLQAVLEVVQRASWRMEP
eukprot:161656-Chlamydomonas_euryale.AAC.4